MKNVLLLTVLLFTVSLSAQGKKIQKSQSATVIQTVGLASVQIDYSRPQMKGREIFGSLVKYNNVWRTGANFCTTINVDKDIMVEGKKLLKGKYSLYTIPKAGNWTIIINRKLSWGTKYDESQDVMRFEGKSETSKLAEESFEISFANVNGYDADVELSWANTRISFGLNTK